MKEPEADDDAVVLALGLLEAAPDAILVIRAGGNIALATRMAERLFGYDRADLSGLPVEALVPHKQREAHERKLIGSVNHREKVSGKLTYGAFGAIRCRSATQGSPGWP